MDDELIIQQLKLLPLQFLKENTNAHASKPESKPGIQGMYFQATQMKPYQFGTAGNQMSS